ncbi:MAG: hypothetical protein LQ349_001101 [Xanthoria aureola]|nr:MAG: hypothetical protein LQ349_001101 [Xanthoria aureola]
MVFGFNPFFKHDARNRKAPAPAGAAHDSTEEEAHRTSPTPIKPTSAGSKKLKETRRKILQGVKKRLDQLGIALKFGKNVRRNRPLAVRIRTHVSSRLKRPSSEKVPAPSVLGSTSADKLTALPEEAEHPRANDCPPLAQYQQETVRYIQPMDTKRTPTATHPGQVKATKSDAIETPLGPSKLEGDPNSSEDKRDTIRERSSANPCQALRYSPAAEDVASPPEPQKRGDWKYSFHMVVHLAKGEDAVRVARLDTGSTVDVISIDVVNSLGLAKEQYRGPPLEPIGPSYLPQWQVKFDWHVAKYHKTYTSTFAVLDEDHSAAFDILLGTKTVEGIGFYKVDDTVFLIKSDEDEMPPSLGVDDAKHILPTVEVDKQISG